MVQGQFLMKWVNNILDLLQNTARFNADAAFRYNETSSATAMRLIAKRKIINFISRN